MPQLRRVVLDVLKPHDPPMLEFADRIAAIDSVDGATASLIELDQEVQNLKITIEGDSLEYATIEEAVEGLGGTVHSVDHVSCGAAVVDEPRTLQDD